MPALPGSTPTWLAGLFYNPFIATIIIVAGGTLGAVAARMCSAAQCPRDLQIKSNLRVFQFSGQAY